VKTPFYAGLRLLAERSIPKPPSTTSRFFIARRHTPRSQLPIASSSRAARRLARHRRVESLPARRSRFAENRHVALQDLSGRHPRGSPSSTWNTVRRCLPGKRWAGPHSPRWRRSRRFAKPPRYPLRKLRRSRTAPSRSRLQPHALALIEMRR